MLNIIIYNHIWWIILMHIKLHITTCRTLRIVIVIYYMLFILIHRLELTIIVKYFVTKLLYSLAEMMQHKKGVYILANLNHAHRSWVLLFTCKMGMFVIYLHIACKPQNTLDTWGRVWLKKKKNVIPDNSNWEECSNFLAHAMGGEVRRAFILP